MATTAHDRFEIKLVQLPGWAIPLAAAAGLAIVALAGVVGFGLLLLMSPIILGVGAAQMIRNRRKSAEVTSRPWPDKSKPSQSPTPIVIDGDYEVVKTGGRPSNDDAARNRK